MDALMWCEEFVESNGSMEDFYLEGEDKKTFKDAKEALKIFIDKIISKLKEFGVKFQMAMNTMKFSVQLKKLGRNYAKQIRQQDLSKDFAKLGLVSLKIYEDYMSAILKIKSAAYLGKLTDEEVDKRVELLNNRFTDKTDELNMKLEKIAGAAGNKTISALYNVDTIVDNYDKTSAALLKVYDSVEKKSVKALDEIKAARVNIGAAKETKNPGFFKSIGCKIGNAIASAFHKITAFINKLLGRTKSEGGKAVNKAHGKNQNVNEAFELDDLDSIIAMIDES